MKIVNLALGQKLQKVTQQNSGVTLNLENTSQSLASGNDHEDVTVYIKCLALYNLNLAM